MSEASLVETRARPHLTSPIPRHRLGTLSVNQRSYSRVSSKGFYGDESPLLLSPLPLYPRRRSVTFAAAPSVFREERPYYNATHSASAPVSPVAARRGSPPPVSILKSHSSYPDEDDHGRSQRVPNNEPRSAAYDEDGDAGMRGDRGTDAATVTGAGLGGARGAHGHGSPTPQRARSGSRQRLAARRREAQLHHSFYDDSFVEEFVLNAKSELARQQAEAAAEREQAARRPPSPPPATTRVVRSQSPRVPATKQEEKEHVGRMSALQRAKKALLAVVQRRCSSVTPPHDTESRAGADEGRHTARQNSHERASRREAKETSGAAVASAAAQHGARARNEAKQSKAETADNKGDDVAQGEGDDEMDLVRSLEQDADPAVQSALQELLHAAAVGSRQGSRKRPRRHHSLPIVSADALDADDDMDSSDNDDDLERHKRAKLERIVRRLLARRREHKSKRSVVVIDWSDIDSDNGKEGKDEPGATDTVLPIRGQDKSRSVNTSHTRSREASMKAASRSRNAVSRPPPPAPAGSRRAGTASRVRETSAVPELSDSILMDGDQDGPILLTRRPRRRAMPATRSLSHLQGDEEEERDDAARMAGPRQRELMSAEDVERVIRKPPRVTRPAARRAGQHRRAAPHRSNISFTHPSAEDDFPAEEADREVEDEFGVDAEPESASQASLHRANAPRSRRNGPAAVIPPSLGAAVASSTSAEADDPMAVFFQAAFPSPSKFDEMMMHAGGLPETRRNGRRAGHQPNLVLPSSIGRRR